MKSLSPPPSRLLNLRLHLSLSLPSTPQRCTNALLKDTSTQAHNPGDRTTHGPAPWKGSRVNRARLCPTHRLGQPAHCPTRRNEISQTQSFVDTQPHVVKITQAQHSNETSLTQLQRPHNPLHRTRPMSRRQTNIHNGRKRRRAAKNANAHTQPARTPSHSEAQPIAKTTHGRSQHCPPLTHALAQSHRMHTTTKKK